MKVRLQADADLNIAIVHGLRLREPSIDFRTAEAADLRGLHDSQVLTYCAREDRILVSHDRRTMPKHLGDFIRTHSSPGLIIVAQNVSIRSAIESLLRHWLATDSEEFINCIVDLPR